MALFSYHAVRRDGGRVSGQVEAQGRTQAFRKLDRESLQPISLVHQEGIETNGPRTPEINCALPTRHNRFPGGQIILFTDEMSDLLYAGLRCVRVLRDR